ncbi:polysaccharide pyruvyl transferase family protein [Vibrio owensii]|uniref:polysaccharide pyruvyl transferase family protein n=1 Tax=Vibrio owensii TaxID=696485 RepID=UPI00406913A5
MNNKPNTTVGIITFHNAHNYGAVMQAYALFTKLKQLEHKPIFLEDKNSFIHNSYNLVPNFKNPVDFTKRLTKLLLDFDRKKKRSDRFNRFIENYLPCVDISEQKKSVNNVILGSDQIWNPNITSGFDPLFFGKHDNLESENIIAYAASMGKATDKGCMTEEFFKLVSNINKIGVREDKLRLNLESKLDKEVVLTLDPTLLLDKNEWNILTQGVDKLKEEYILVYEVEHHPYTYKVTDYLEDKFKWTTKTISSKSSHKVPRTIITTASPEEFLSLFSQASMIVTSSFHGTVFSIINEKPFVTMKFGNGVDIRAESLLANLGLLNHHIKDVSEFNDNDIFSIDYTSVNEKMDELRSKSVNYLKESLL